MNKIFLHVHSSSYYYHRLVDFSTIRTILKRTHENEQGCQNYVRIHVKPIVNHFFEYPRWSIITNIPKLQIHSLFTHFGILTIVEFNNFAHFLRQKNVSRTLSLIQPNLIFLPFLLCLSLIIWITHNFFSFSLFTFSVVFFSIRSQRSISDNATYNAKQRSIFLIAPQFFNWTIKTFFLQ